MIDQPYEIADAHTHIFPQKIAEKAAHSIADFYKVNAGDVGTGGHSVGKRQAPWH